MEEGDSSLSQSPPSVTLENLLEAVLEDDYKATEAFFQKYPDCLSVAITKEEGTFLHFAAAAKRTRFVKKLVKRMAPVQLELKTKGNCTALYYAAQSEIVTIAEEMVKRNNKLPLIPKDDIQVLPLYAAIMTGNRDMVSYLYSVTPIEELASLDRIQLLNATISTDLYDIALKILDTLNLVDAQMEYLWFPLKMLATKPSEIGNKSQPSVWAKCLNSWSRGRLCNKAVMQASAHQLVNCLWERFRNDNNFSDLVPQQKLLVVEAAKVGNVEFLVILIRSYPDLIWKYDKTYGTLFHVAVKHRQESVFSLIYETGVMKGELASIYDEDNKSMLHLAGELPLSDRLNIVSGGALQMQRELRWFQEIEKIRPKPSMSGQMGPEVKLSHPREIFAETHEALRKNGEKWMKDTANSCMLVATLIATVVFPAAFTIPGGNNQETDIPRPLESKWLMVFFVTDAMAMVFSSFSILIFLSILMSRYTEKDFLKSLPLRLAWGLATLLISIIGMLIAFTAAWFLVFKSNSDVSVRSLIYVAPVTAISICLFGILDYRLWFDIFRSAFWSKKFISQSQNRLFNSKLQAALFTEMKMTTSDIIKQSEFFTMVNPRFQVPYHGE